MSTPISPPPVTEGGRPDLPAYVSNGLIGLRVLDIPLLPGVVLVSGFTGRHPEVEVESAAQAPYPVAGDIGINGVWLRTSPHQASFVEQRYDFGTGELTTRFTFSADGVTARVEVLTLCSQTQPTIVLQEIVCEVDRECDLVLRALVDIGNVHGRPVRRHVMVPGPDEDVVEGALSWQALGGQSECGIAYVTKVEPPDVERTTIDWGLESSLATDCHLRAGPGRPLRLRQIASMVPSQLHHEPDQAARRLVARAAAVGFDTLRDENRREWEQHWKARIHVVADDDRWQELADAAFFYLNTSVHPSAPASTSMYGLGQWNDYHYYYGHVMWDIEMFCVPPLILTQPDAARTLLEYRVQATAAARQNARLMGRRGIQFPWQSGPLHGEESAPGAGKASWYEDHVSLDVAWAFSQYAHATGDQRFLREEAASILYGVADWIASRVSPRGNGFEIRQTMGIAERPHPADNDAFTIMGAQRVLQEAIACGERLDDPVRPVWREVLAGLRVRTVGRDGAIRSHDGYRPNEKKGATPGPLAGLFPLWADVAPAAAQATLDYYLRLAPEYVGSPMLSPLYGVWACWAGHRSLAARLYEEGYAELVGPRFLQTLEQSPTRYPEKPPSGPFFANLGGFLMGLLYGLPGIRVGPGEPSAWPTRPVVLPEGWRSIEVERAWVRMQPARIVARHGAERAVIDVERPPRRRAA